MRHTLVLSLVLAALPALAADPPLPPTPAPGTFLFANTTPVLPLPTATATAQRLPLPATPPPVTWEVWGFQWDGSRWVKQPTRCLKTTDLKRAIDYAKEVFILAGWHERHNIPSDLMPVWHVDDPLAPGGQDTGPTNAPPDPLYTVWAFKLVDDKWVKDEAFCRATDSRPAGLDYTKKLNAIHGWCATTNCPGGTPSSSRPHAYLGTARGVPYGYGYSGNGGYIGNSRGGYPTYSEHGGRTIYRPHMTIRLGADADWHYRHTPHPDPIDP